MPPLRIIYTPDADKFRLACVSSCFPKFKGDPETNAMRESFSKLREKVPDLPAIVGVATFNDVLRAYTSKMREKMKGNDMAPMTTTYYPLDVMDAAMKLRDEDLANPLTAEYVYRSLSFLLLHHSVIVNDDAPGYVNSAIIIGPNIPGMELSARELQDLLCEVGKTDDNGPRRKIEASLRRGLDFLSGTGSWEKIGRAREWFYERFGANQVSRGFPLFFMKPAYSVVELATVSLEDKYEERKLPDGFEEIFRAGCRLAQGEVDADERLSELKGPAKDFFGRTESFTLMEELLGSLPDPKTLITDLYIVDHFPDLKKTGFTPIEYMLPG
jgi:hypothetical protein